PKRCPTTSNLSGTLSGPSTSLSVARNPAHNTFYDGRDDRPNGFPLRAMSVLVLDAGWAGLANPLLWHPAFRSRKQRRMLSFKRHFARPGPSGDSLHEAARIYYPSRRRGDGVAPFRSSPSFDQAPSHADLLKAWQAPTTSARDKKELLRTLLEE